LSVLILAGWPVAAEADDNDPAAWCKNGGIPFDATDANRLSDAEIRRVFSGKRLGYIRETIKPPGQYLNAYRELRSDGSVAHVCQNGPTANGPWRLCKLIGSEQKSVAGARDVGVWNIKNRTLCTTPAAFGPRAEVCFAIHRQGETLAARQVSGPRTYCIQGVVTAQ
jgi:hypothetical protein